MLEHTEITQSRDGSWVAAGTRVGMTVASGESRIFKRRAMRPFAAGGTKHEAMLVGELDGVRAYVIEREGQVHIVMTRQDLMPEFDA